MPGRLRSLEIELALTREVGDGCGRRREFRGNAIENRVDRLGGVRARDGGAKELALGDAREIPASAGRASERETALQQAGVRVERPDAQLGVKQRAR